MQSVMFVYHWAIFSYKYWNSYLFKTNVIVSSELQKTEKNKTKKKDIVSSEFQKKKKEKNAIILLGDQLDANTAP